MSVKYEVPTIKINFALLYEKSAFIFHHWMIFLAVTVYKGWGNQLWTACCRITVATVGGL
jgi:hypothetical protein